MNNIHNEHIYYIQQTIKKFELGNIDFHDFKSRMVGCTVGLENHINCDYDLDRLIDVWFESIEFCYLEKDWQLYGLEAGYFILEASKAFPNKVYLPENSNLVKDQLIRFFEK